MSVYIVTGKLGAGKTLCAVGRIRDAMVAGKRIATNLDIFPEHLVGGKNKTAVIRLPDKPRLCDLEAIGYGCDKPDYSEREFGLIVLDELGSWFNSRSWSDKERLPVIDWFLHARKKRWHLLLIVQDVDIIDKQLRDSLCEHLVVCRRLDRFVLPFVGKFIKFLTGYSVKMPQVHVASVYYSDRPDKAMWVERWWYRGKDLYRGYDTGQVFKSGKEMVGDELRDMRCVSTLLSAWHVKGRHPKQPKPPGLILTLARMPYLLPFVLWALVLSLADGRSTAARLITWGLCRPRNRASSGHCELAPGALAPSVPALDATSVSTVRRPRPALDLFTWRLSGCPLTSSLVAAGSDPLTGCHVATTDAGNGAGEAPDRALTA